MKNKVIMGIDPGLRTLGLAVLSRRGGILEAEILSAQAKDPASKCIKYMGLELEKRLERYRPSVVVLEKTWPTRHRSLAQVRRVALLCRRRVARRRIPVIEVPVSTVRKVVAGYGWATKTETAQVLAALYPELQLYLRQGRAWKDRHFQNLFDAVALALWYRKTH
jgi:Holliday junction resolvasome RuvABC endonuclease subunit